MKIGERLLLYGNGGYIEIKKIKGKDLVIENKTGKIYHYNERLGLLKEVITQ